jgi:hypothetical protein
MNASTYDKTLAPPLREVLETLKADHLKSLAKLLNPPLKATRKSDIIKVLEETLLSDSIVDYWKSLAPISRSAIAEAAHSSEGTFNRTWFSAKYGKLPVFETKTKPYGPATLKPINLFLFSTGRWDRSSYIVPSNLRNRLLEFISKPPETEFGTLEKIPD